MASSENSTIDIVRELRLRQWARQHFVAPELRKSTWHPVVLDEMSRRDRELFSEVSQNDVDIKAAETSIVPPPHLAVHGLRNDHFKFPGNVFVPLEPTIGWHTDVCESNMFEIEPSPGDYQTGANF